ncbi:MAG: hypothetical protein ACKVHL_06510 [Rhodospirillales bacterium]
MTDNQALLNSGCSPQRPIWELVRLPVLGLIKLSYIFVFQNFRSFIKAATIPFLGLTTVALIQHWMPKDTALSVLFSPFIFKFFSVIFFALMAVKWHQFYLLGKDFAEPKIKLSFGPIEKKFCAFAIIMTAVGLAPQYMIEYFFIEAMPKGRLRDPSNYYVIFAIYYCALTVLACYFARFLLIFPAIATNVSQKWTHDVSASWRLLPQNTLRFFIAGVLAYIPFHAINIILKWYTFKLYLSIQTSLDISFQKSADLIPIYFSIL